MLARAKKSGRTSLIFWNLAVWMFAALLNQGMAAQVSATPSNDQAQIEKGRQVVAQTCAACHTTIMRMVQVHKQTREQWKDTIYFMISRGAQIMPDEIEPVAAYLVSAGGSGPATTQAPGRGGGRGVAGGAVQQTPEGDGRAVLQRVCQQCHDLATASTKPASEEWSAVVTRMTAYGARLTPADQEKLIAYLNSLAK